MFRPRARLIFCVWRPTFMKNYGYWKPSTAYLSLDSLSHTWPMAMQTSDILFSTISGISGLTQRSNSLCVWCQLNGNVCVILIVITHFWKIGFSQILPAFSICLRECLTDVLHNWFFRQGQWMLSARHNSWNLWFLSWMLG